MKLRVYSHAGGRSGYARAANDYALALHRAGVELDLVPLDRDPAFEGAYAPLAGLCYHHHHQGPNAPMQPDVVMVHTLPLDCARVLQLECERGALDENIPAVAYTTWEAQTAPREVFDDLAARFELVLVPSERTKIAITKFDRRTIRRVVPHCIDEETLASRKGPGYRARTGKPFTFYYVGAWNNRKNPHGVIRAFAHAFEPGEAELVVHCPGVAKERIFREIASLGISQDRLAKIWPSIKHKTDDEIIELHAKGADCFVTAARGEAWNLPAFEAMCAGRPVIAPVHLGSDEYLAGWSGAVFYSGRLTIATDDMDGAEIATDEDGRMHARDGRGAQGISAKCLWLEPDLVELAGVMRSCASSTIATTVPCDIAATYGYAAVAKQLITLLESVL